MRANPLRWRSRAWLCTVITVTYLLIIPALVGSASHAQPATDADVISTVRDFAQSKDINQWLSKNRSMLTSNFLAAVQNLANQAIDQGGQTGDVRAFYFARTANLMVANALLQQGDQAGALRAFIGEIDIEFTLADSNQAYQHVLLRAADSARKAAQIGAAELEFRARVIAADSCYQASILKDADVDTRQKWEHGSLVELSKAAKLAGSFQSRWWMERFVSLSGAVLGDAQDHFGYGGDETARIASLKQLTSSYEMAVPAEFSYEVRPKKNWTDDVRLAGILAALSFDHGRASIGAARLRHAVRLARSHGDTDRLASSLAQLYEGEKRRFADPANLIALRAEIRDAISSLRAGYISRGGRLWAAARTDLMLGQVTSDELSANGKISDIFGAIETLKARLLLDQISLYSQSLRSASAINEAAGIERELLAFPSCAHRDDNLSTRELLLLSRMSLATPFTQDEDRERVRKVEEIYRRESAGFEGVASPPSLASVQAALKPDEVIVEYFIPYHGLHPAFDLWIVVVTSTRTAIQHVALDRLLPKVLGMIGSIAVDNCPPLDASPLGDAVATLRVALQTTDERSANDWLRLFNRILVEPVVKAGFKPADFKHWIIVPHGPIHYVPFAALIDENGKFLIQHVALSVSPSAAVWLREQSVSRGSPSNVAGLFAPISADPAFQALPSSARETAAILARFPGADDLMFSGADATKRKLWATAPKADILHLSAHGDFPEIYAIDRHAVLLSNDGSDEGRLTAAEIRTLDLSRAALVVLMICNGGLYNVGPSDEPYGLVPAFLVAGATDVLSTLWPIEDEFGRRFVARFYDHLSGEGSAQALREAMLTFINDGELIRRWSGLVLTGPGRPLVQ